MKGTDRSECVVSGCPLEVQRLRLASTRSTFVGESFWSEEKRGESEANGGEGDSRSAAAAVEMALVLRQDRGGFRLLSEQEIRALLAD